MRHPNLFHTVPGLQVGVVSCPDGAHAGGLVARVALRAVLKVRVGPPWTVDANVARVIDVGAPVRLAHHGNNSYLHISR